MKRVAVLGASGYSGIELLRLISGHPGMSVAKTGADTSSGSLLASSAPSLAPLHPDTVLESIDVEVLDGLDAVFLCLPIEVSMNLVPSLRRRVGVVTDLSAAFRLRDPAAYPQWYGVEHTCPELLVESVHGLPEYFRDALRNATLVATPGCYVTAATLALKPLCEAGIIGDRPVIVDAASGTSGAGRTARQDQFFAEVDGGLQVYGLLDHRHTPEIEQATGATVLFTPHLAPMTRGILATCYVPQPEGSHTTASLLATLARAYKDESFVTVAPNLPSTKATLGSNSTRITARFDERTNTIIVIAALDNLTKGAAGGALQSTNIALGLEESAGLPGAGVWP